jgi:hypothetical protein
VIGVGALGVATKILSSGGSYQPSLRSTRLLVYGATPSGVMAACAGVRDGLDVVLVAGESPLGGMMTSGLSHSDVGDVSAIGGLAAGFFRAVGRHYGSNRPIYDFEPHVASGVFTSLLNSYRLDVRSGIVAGLTKSGVVVTSIRLLTGESIAADVFVDASYEGSLLRLADVATRYGRESRTAYDESAAGFGVVLTPYRVNPSEGSRLDQNVAPDPMQRIGAADFKIPAYTFRLCVTDRDDNKVAYPRPANYDPARYRLLARSLPEVPYRPLMTPLPNRKFDLNGGGFFSTDYIGGSWGFPAARLAQRRTIWQNHFDYQAGLLYFLANDPSLPARVREQAASFGLAADEFTTTQNWPEQLYIREGRRLRGQYTLTQSDLFSEPTKPDPVAVGSYTVDCHGVQRFQSPSDPHSILIDGSIPARVAPVRKYQIPYRSLLPVTGEATNLLASVCVSTTHVAWSSLRMEPQFMILGEAAGVAAALAAKQRSIPSDVDTSELRAKLLSYGAVLEVS